MRKYGMVADNSKIYICWLDSFEVVNFNHSEYLGKTELDADLISSVVDELEQVLLPNDGCDSHSHFLDLEREEYLTAKVV